MLNNVFTKGKYSVELPLFDQIIDDIKLYPFDGSMYIPLKIDLNFRRGTNKKTGELKSGDAFLDIYLNMDKAIIGGSYIKAKVRRNTFRPVAVDCYFVDGDKKTKIKLFVYKLNITTDIEYTDNGVTDLVWRQE